MSYTSQFTSLPLSSGNDAQASILLYTPHLLSTVQHYVREHALRLRRYRPLLAGRRRVPGTAIDDLPHFTFGSGSFARMQEFGFLATGRSRSIKAFIREHNVRLIHAHFGTGGTEIMKIAADLNLPLVTTFHGWDVKLNAEAEKDISPYERLYRFRLPALFKQAARVICVSHKWSERVVQLGCPPEKVMTNYLGVDSSFFDGKRGDFDPFSVLFVGRLVKRKGVSTLLEAINLIHQQGALARLTVVGEGPELESLRRQAERLRIDVTFTGKRAPTEVRELLRTSAVLCAPSTTAGDEVPEALGLVLIEAEAMGVPVVGTRNGGIPETILDGVTGYLVEQDNATLLAEALMKLLGNEELNREIGERARLFVSERFDIQRSYESLENLYDSLLSQG